MNRRQFVAGAASALVLNKCLNLSPARADEVSPEVQKAIDKGIDWLLKQQQRDGHWESPGGQYPPVMTSLAGLALLMEGSTLREGKHADRIRKAVDWLIDHTRPNGLIGNPNNPIEMQRYMYGHGYGLLFLASVYGEEEDQDRRKKLEDLLTKSVDFCGKAQTSIGGWGYVSAADGNNFDEGSVTITQMQALRAARNAGIVVPKSVIDKARDYLEKSTQSDGQVGYRIGRRAITPGLTSAGISCMFSSGEYGNPIVLKWLNYCKANITPMGGGARQGHDEYTQYYWAQALYILGETGFMKLFPKADAKDNLTWSAYRKPTFEHLVKSQSSDGSWTGGGNWSGVGGPVYVTSLYLAILQLDKGVLPIYQR
ncbi:MAG: terpene cyclase/mutase family protein [Gemmataceae bacterium]|nr:terpene cyclase/mutase family protein [Gemmataceae bacterium]